MVVKSGSGRKVKESGSGCEVESSGNGEVEICRNGSEVEVCSVVVVVGAVGGGVVVSPWLCLLPTSNLHSTSSASSSSLSMLTNVELLSHRMFVNTDFFSSTISSK